MPQQRAGKALECRVSSISRQSSTDNSMNQASGSRRTRHFGVPRRALEHTAGNTLLLEHSDAVETRLDDDVSNIAEDYRQLNRCGASTAGIVKISVSYCSAALRTDVDRTRGRIGPSATTRSASYPPWWLWKDRHTGASEYSARALQLHAAYSVSAVTVKIWMSLVWRTLHPQLL